MNLVLAEGLNMKSKDDIEAMRNDINNINNSISTF